MPRVRKPTGKSSRKYSRSVKGSGDYRRPSRKQLVQRQPIRTLRGRGDYKSVLGTILKGAGIVAGGMTGGLPGALKGGLTAGALGNLMGLGDYRVKTNSLVRPGMNDQIPSMHNSKGCVRIQHREYLGDILGSTTFENRSYAINPADVITFPWLSQIAVNFEQWVPKGIIFEFRTMSSDTQIGSTVSLGTVILATEYNVLLNRFISKQQMENSQFSMSVKPSNSCIHPVECDPSQTPNMPLFVKVPSASLGDARLYDLGNFQLATQGMTATGAGQVIGELWCSYDIEFCKPVLSAGDSVFADSASYNLQDLQTGIGYTSPGLLGDITFLQAAANKNYDQIGLTFPGGASDRILFPASANGRYEVDIYFSGSILSASDFDVAPLITTSGTVSLVSVLPSSGGYLASSSVQRVYSGVAPDPATFAAHSFHLTAQVQVNGNGVDTGLLFLKPALAATGANYPTGAPTTFGLLMVNQVYTPPVSSVTLSREDNLLQSLQDQISALQVQRNDKSAAVSISEDINDSDSINCVINREVYDRMCRTIDSYDNKKKEIDEIVSRVESSIKKSSSKQ